MYLHLSWACYLRKFWQTGSWQESCHLRLLYCALFLLISAVYSKCSLVVSIARKISINSHFTVHVYVPVISDVDWAKYLGLEQHFASYMHQNEKIVSLLPISNWHFLALQTTYFFFFGYVFLWPTVWEGTDEPHLFSCSVGKIYDWFNSVAYPFSFLNIWPIVWCSGKKNIFLDALGQIS